MIKVLAATPGKLSVRMSIAYDAAQFVAIHTDFKHLTFGNKVNVVLQTLFKQGLNHCIPRTVFEVNRKTTSIGKYAGDMKKNPQPKSRQVIQQFF